MTDPLSLLREYNISKKPITETNNRIIFGEYSFPKTTKTNYLVWGSGKDGIPKDYYTLESLLFLLKNVQLFHPVYVQQANAENIPIVKRPIRKDILAYLNGDTSESARIDKDALNGDPIKVKHGYEDDNEQKVTKKPRLEENEIQSAEDQQPAEITSSEETCITKHIRSLSDAMSVEKIAALKAKRLAKKCSTINTDNDVSPDYTEIQNLKYDVVDFR